MHLLIFDRKYEPIRMKIDIVFWVVSYQCKRINVVTSILDYL